MLSSVETRLLLNILVNKFVSYIFNYNYEIVITVVKQTFTCHLSVKNISFHRRFKYLRFYPRKFVESVKQPVDSSLKKV